MATKPWQSRSHRLFAGAGILVIFAGLFAYSEAINRYEIDAKVVTRSVTPTKIGFGPSFSITIAPHADLPETRLTLTGGWIPAGEAALRQRWEAIRPGCRYRLSILRHRAKHGQWHSYNLTDESLLSCEQASPLPYARPKIARVCRQAGAAT